MRDSVSQRQDSRDGDCTCEIVHGDCGWQRRLDDFGNMLDLLNKGSDSGLLQDTPIVWLN
jgi:hypothetical protein